jgi:hypothetical protein
MHFAVVPPILIRSQPDLQDLVRLLGSLLSQFYSSLISAENAPYILQVLFQPDKEETTEPQDKEDFSLTEATQESSESTNKDVHRADPFSPQKQGTTKPRKLDPGQKQKKEGRKGDFRGFGRKRPCWRNLSESKKSR